MSLKTHYGIFNNIQVLAILTQNGKLDIVGNDSTYGGDLNFFFNDFFWLYAYKSVFDFTVF